MAAKIPLMASYLEMAALVLFLLSAMSSRTSVEAIMCYQCNAIEQPLSTCPGWHRPPVDTLVDRNDKGGLFTHCVEIR